MNKKDIDTLLKVYGITRERQEWYSNYQIYKDLSSRILFRLLKKGIIKPCSHYKYYYFLTTPQGYETIININSRQGKDSIYQRALELLSEF